MRRLTRPPRTAFPIEAENYETLHTCGSAIAAPSEHLVSLVICSNISAPPRRKEKNGDALFPKAIISFSSTFPAGQIVQEALEGRLADARLQRNLSSSKRSLTTSRPLAKHVFTREVVICFRIVVVKLLFSQW